MNSVRDDPEGPGFPIRKSPDQSFFAAPRSLTQRNTSFIASMRQGIHHMLLPCLRSPPCTEIRSSALPQNYIYSLKIIPRRNFPQGWKKPHIHDAQHLNIKTENNQSRELSKTTPITNPFTMSKNTIPNQGILVSCLIKTLLETTLPLTLLEAF